MAEAALKAKGWHLTSAGLNELTQDGGNKMSVDKIIDVAKNTDLRDVGEKCLPEEINRGKCEYIEGPLVLQVQKIRNVSAPKDNEESQTAPRMLRMTLTDGQLNCSAVEMEKLYSFGLNTAPGTKLCLKGTVEVENGFLLLTNKNTAFIGGRVEKLAENWELKKLLAKQSVTRANLEQEGGPPPFVPFGQRVRDSKSASKPVKRDNFKSLQEKDKEKKTEDGEFQQQRQAVIAEALQAKGEGKSKTFGGGQKQIGQDRDVSKIVEMGFSAEDASRALKEHNGNVNMAINMLISGGGQYMGRSYNRQSDSRDFNKDRNFSKDDKRPPLKEDKRENTRGRGRRRDQDDDSAIESVSSKPSGPATLFDFLETKIKPTANDKGKTPNQSVPSSRNEQNSYKSSDYPKPTNQNQQDRSKSQYNNKPDRNSNSYHNSGRGDNSGRDYSSRDSRPQSGPADSSYSRQDSRKDTRQDQNSYNKDRNYNNDRRNPRQNFDSEHGKSENNTYSSGNRDSRNFQDQQRNQNRPKSAQVSNNRTQENRNENYNRGRSNDSYSAKSDNRQQNSYNNRSEGNRQSNSQNSYSNWQGDSYNDSRAQSGSQGNRSKFNEGQQFSGSSYKQHQNRDSYNNKKFQKDSQEFHSDSCPPLPNTSVPPPPLWRNGDQCLAKYWEDGKFYRVVITNVKPDLPTCVVRFTDYGNEEEVNFSDLRPFNKQMNDYSRSQGGQGQNRSQQYLPQSQHEQRLNTDNYSNYGDQRHHGRGYQGGANYDQNYGRQGYDNNQTNQISSMEFRRRRTEPNRPAQQLYQPPGRQHRDK